MPFGTGPKLFTALPTLTPHPVRAEAAYPFALVANKFATVYFLWISQLLCVSFLICLKEFFTHMSVDSSVVQPGQAQLSPGVSTIRMEPSLSGLSPTCTAHAYPHKDLFTSFNVKVNPLVYAKISEVLFKLRLHN